MTNNKLLIILITICFVINTLFINTINADDEPKTAYYVVALASDIRVRTGPSIEDEQLKIDGTLQYYTNGASYNIIGESQKDKDDLLWYNINYQKNGVDYSAWIREDCCTLKEYSYDTSYDFQQELNNFPESYRDKLTALHKLHPNWIFKAFLTDLTWDELLKNETVLRRNLIQTSNLAYRSKQAGAYNSETKQYIPLDGTNWYQADSEVIAYYMDPRNFIVEDDIFMFLKLKYSPTETVASVQRILNGTFMEGKDPVDGRPYAEIFIEAAHQADVSAVYLATLAIQEQGTRGSAASTGQSFTYEGKTYSGYYNFYNIHASGGADNWKKGLVYAAGNDERFSLPWTSPAKAITGGALWIAYGYIADGQDTLYFQKFNSYDRVYWHQYQTNVKAAYSESYTIYKAYKSTESFNSSIVFTLPVYLNMPEKTELPTEEKPDQPIEPVNPQQPKQIIEGLSLTVKDNYIYGFEYNSTVGDFTEKAVLINKDEIIKITKDNVEVNNEVLLATGMKLSINDKEYTIIIKGDCNGDGKITSLDYVRIKNHIMSTSVIKDANLLEAADVSCDGKITSLDYVKVKNTIMAGDN